MYFFKQWQALSMKALVISRSKIVFVDDSVDNDIEPSETSVHADTCKPEAGLK